MSSTKQHQTRQICVASALATLVACVTCVSSLTFSPSVEAHQAAIEDEPVLTEGNVEVAVTTSAKRWVNPSPAPNKPPIVDP
jgi:hypothetical protein